MFDETSLMSNANGKFDFIKHLNFHQKLIKQLIPFFDENVWCICAGLKVHTRDKLYKRYPKTIQKLTKLYVDEEICKEARNVVQNLIQKKKKHTLRKNYKENTKSPKKLWKTLKQLGLSDTRSPSTNTCLDAKNGLTFDSCRISEVFKKLFSNLANDLVQKLPAAAKKFGNKSVDYYNDKFNLNPKKLT